MDRVKIKAKAKELISGKIFILLAITLVTAVVGAVCGLIPVAGGIAMLLIMGGFELATAMIYLGIAKKNRTPKIEDLLEGFKGENFMRGFEGYIRYTLFTALWSMLFVIPGIIKSIEYSQMFYLMADNPKMSAGEAQKKSMEMMQGHRWEFFVWNLSFIPWFMLVGITFGIAAIYVTPYMSTTFALYYRGLAEKNSPIEKIKEAVEAKVKKSK